MLHRIHRHLPASLASVTEDIYYAVHPSKRSPEHVHAAFVERCFDDVDEYERYREEFFHGEAAAYRERALDNFERAVKTRAPGDLNPEAGARIYSLLRKEKPETIVETGVCNGMSTVYVLSALAKNDSGRLYSIDYPLRANESLEKFREETFDEYGGAAIPADKDPGWIIPDELRNRWTLRIGKSQVELPKLRAEIDEIDVFIHDSEHSEPCMMMEFELAYNWLRDGGYLIADDIHWNDAFETFTSVRKSWNGLVHHGVGYARK